VVPVPTITAALSHAEVAISSPVVISGAVRPIGATPRVVAQRLIDGRWVDRDAAPVDPTTGRYRITIHPTQIADYRLRVRSDQGSVHSGTLALSTFYVAYDMVDTGDALPGERVVAFTFDDGPNPTYTPRVLDVLAKYGVKATFSVVGEWAARYPDLVRREVREGHRIANHTYTHPSLPSLSNAAIRAELGATQDLILKAGGAPRCVRPPGGATNLRVEQVITEFRASATLLWNVDPSNYKRPGTSVIVSRVMGALRPGAIIGIHDGGGDRSQTVAALDQLIPLIRDAGYQIRPVC
jgi:peptidoglycan/xylan/chitin deacetylase (PgdA/CDA1 family)